MRNIEHEEIEKNAKDEAQEKARRNIMLMQMFNYDRTNRDCLQRPIEMTAAVAAGSKEKQGKQGLVTTIIYVILAAVMLGFVLLVAK